MPPSSEEAVNGKEEHQRRKTYPQPLTASGDLDRFEHEDVTPVIGREYDLNIVEDLLNAQNGDSLIRDLAIASG